MATLNNNGDDGVALELQQTSDATQHPKTATRSRRNFLKTGVSTAAAVTAGTGLSFTSNTAIADIISARRPDRALNGQYRAIVAAQLKVDMAEQHFNHTVFLPSQRDNRDERRYAKENFYASYSKSLPSNEFGEVNPRDFRKLRRAIRRGRTADFAAIRLSSGATRRLTNPQACFKFETCGLDSHATRIDPSHRFRSADIAAQVGEVYWQALTRDVPFIEYQDSALIDAAVNDLNKFSVSVRASDNGATNAARLFRGETLGDLEGPYISQFLLNDISFGPSEMVQRYQQPTPRNFMVDTSNWLNVQRGGTPDEQMDFEADRRYIYNNRTLGEYVHRDISFQAFLNACAQLLELGVDAIDSSNPYSNELGNQDGFVTFGAPFAVDLVTRVANIALTGAWFQKWRVHRFLRPEAYGGRVHFHLSGQRQYELHSDILNCDAVQRVFSLNGSYLLPQAFTEGSPTHPSFPAGHACVAGACVTALKAFFNEDYVIDNPVEADAQGLSLLPFLGSNLTVGGELNKLANNIAIGRDGAGVHYRQDGAQGLKAGEQQAIAYLRDQSRTLNEAHAAGFTLRKFDGTKIHISNGRVTEL